MYRGWRLLILAGLLSGCRNEVSPPLVPLPKPPVPVVSTPLPPPELNATTVEAASSVTPLSVKPPTTEKPAKTPKIPETMVVEAVKKIAAPHFDTLPLRFHAPAFIRSGDSAEVTISVHNQDTEAYSGRLRWRAVFEGEELDASGSEVCIAPGEQSTASWSVTTPGAGILYLTAWLENETTDQSPLSYGRITILPAGIRHRQEFTGYLPREATESHFLTLQLPDQLAPETPRLQISLVPDKLNRPEPPHASELELKLDGELLGRVHYTPEDPAMPGVATFALPGSSGRHSLELKRGGAEACSYRLQLEYFEHPGSGDGNAAASADGIRVERDYFLLEALAEPITNVSTVTWQNRIYRRIPLKNLTAVAPGALLEANVTVTAPESWQGSLLTDPIPGGCRTLEADADPVQRQFRPEAGEPPRKVFSHLLQVEFPGVYLVPPATLQITATDSATSAPSRITVEAVQADL